MWMRDRGIEYANEVAIYLGITGAIIGFAMFFVQAANTIARKRNENGE